MELGKTMRYGGNNISAPGIMIKKENGINFITSI
jgi:hypothetical protein